jgi:hypothetical protein
VRLAEAGPVDTASRRRPDRRELVEVRAKEVLVDLHDQ